MFYFDGEGNQEFRCESVTCEMSMWHPIEDVN